MGRDVRSPRQGGRQSGHGANGRKPPAQRHHRPAGRAAEGAGAHRHGPVAPPCRRYRKPSLRRSTDKAMEKLAMILEALPFIAAIVVISVGGWVFTTWLKIKNGYPLETSWGQPLHPVTDKEAVERIKLLTNENAQLRAELGSVKDRLETIERIVTDQPSKLAREI